MANSCRISFDYAVRRNKETRFEELPFVICVIANFSGTKERSVNAPRASRFIRVAPHSLKDVFRSVGPSLHVEFGEPVCAGKRCEELSIDFRSLEDFAPQRIASLLYEQYAASDFIDVSAAPPPGVPDYLKQRVDEILHNPSFKNLHSTWLGVDMLLKTVASPSLQVLMLDIRKEDLLSKRPSEHGLQVRLHQEIEDMTQTIGSHPPSAVLVDFQLGPRDVQLLSALARLVESVPTALIAAASPDFLPRDKYSNLNRVDGTALAHKEMGLFAEWRNFRRQEFAKHLFLVLPPVLFRLPYSNIAIPIVPDQGDVWTYNESSGDYLWGSSVYAVGCLLIRSFARYGWVAALSPLESPGMTLKFPIQPPDAISLAPVGPTAVSVFRRSCSFFSELGFLTISDCKGSPIVSMFEDHSCSIVDDVSTHLIYLLLCARLRRALLLYARSINLPGLDDSAAIAKLRSWLTKYTSTEPQADDKVRYPIESSDVSISSDDVFRCFTIRAEINIGGHRRAHVHFEMTMRSGSALSGKAEASLDMSFRVGAEGLRTRRGGAVTP